MSASSAVLATGTPENRYTDPDSGESTPASGLRHPTADNSTANLTEEMMQEGAMLRTPRAAEYLGVSAATLCKWRVFGGGPRYKKLGRAVVYDPADLRDWLDARSQGSTSDRADDATSRARSG